MAKTKAIVVLRIPETHSGRFALAGGLISKDGVPKEPVIDSMEVGASFCDFAASRMMLKDVSVYHIEAASEGMVGEGYLSWIKSPSVNNANPLSCIFDIEDSDGVITSVQDWASWSRRRDNITSLYPSSVASFYEASVCKIIIMQFLENNELPMSDYEVHLFHSGSQVRGGIAQNIEDDWDRVILHESDSDDDARVLPEGRVAKNQRATTELMLHLISASTVVDDLVGVKDRSDYRRNSIGKPYVLSNNLDTDARYYPVISIEANPREEASVRIKGWLFAFSGDAKRGDENAQADFTRSLINVFKGTSTMQELLSADLFQQMVDAFKPMKDQVSVSIDDEGAVRTFLLGDVWADMDSDNLAEIRKLWQVSSDTPNMLRAAIAFQKSQAVDVEMPSNPKQNAKKDESVKPIMADSSAKVESLETTKKPEPVKAKKKEGSSKAAEVALDKAIAADKGREEDSVNLLVKDIEALRADKRLKIKPLMKKIKKRVIAAGEAGVFISYSDLQRILEESGFVVSESLPKGLRVMLPPEKKQRNFTGNGQDNIFHPAFHARKTCEADKPSEIIRLTVEAVSSPIFAPPQHWPKALLSALQKKGDPEQQLLKGDGNLEHVLVYRFLDWLLGDPANQETPPTKKYTGETLGNASAINDALESIRDAITKSDADEKLDVLDEADYIWSGDLKDGKAFFKIDVTPPNTEDILT